MQPMKYMLAQVVKISPRNRLTHFLFKPEHRDIIDILQESIWRIANEVSKVMLLIDCASVLKVQAKIQGGF